MHPTKYLAAGAVAAVAALAMPIAPAGASAAPTTVTFSGTVTTAMSVNNGTTVATVPAGTAYTGSFTYDAAQVGTTSSFGGGTRTVYSFTALTFTIGSSTATSGSGTIDVFDNLTTNVGYPAGDSVYVNFTQGTPNTTGVAPNGLLDGAAFNWMGLAFLDAGGTAITNGQLPSSFGAAAFPVQFSEFNFGTAGTPFGAGNTSMIQSMASGGTPPPAPLAFAPTLAAGMVGAPYASTFATATGGTAPYTYSATGLPAGLFLSGTTVSGTPSVGGVFPVTLTATDSAGAALTVQVTFSVGAHAHFGVPSEGRGTITKVGPHDSFLLVGGHKLEWTPATDITVSTPTGVHHVIDSSVVPGMTASWEGLATKSGAVVQAGQLTIS